MKKHLLFIISLVYVCMAYGQQPTFGKIPLTKVKEKDKRTSFTNLLSANGQMASGTSFKISKRKRGKLHMDHITYQQYYNGIKVIYGTVKMHQKNGDNTSYNGAYYDVSGVNTTPQISEQEVISIAKSYFSTNDIFWIQNDGISKTNTPELELAILPNRKKETFNLVYTIGVGISSPSLKMGVLYIDAKTGNVLKFKNSVFSCFEHKHHEDLEINNLHNHSSEIASLATGSAQTVYSGTQSIGTTLDTDYILYDQSRANTGDGLNIGLATKNGIATVNMNHSTVITDYNNASVLTEFTDSNNTWTASDLSTDEDQYALDAHWGAQVVYDYFNTVHGRKSYDDSNSAMVSYVHYATDYTNASWVSFTNGNGFMIYGDGGGSYTPLTTLDVAAHEIGHGITNNSAELDYELESGAINESLSDIWAMVIDNYANTNLGTSKNIRTINDENNGGTVRSMSNPNTYNQPDTYGGTHWIDTASCTPDGDVNSPDYNDYCGVHTNSGVLNYWFWLLSQGGSGTNDNGDSYTVTAIGIDDAAAIAYRMQNTYLTATSDYADTRTHAIQSAIDLFGNCSTQEASVTNAFYAVGVGEAFPTYCAYTAIPDSNFEAALEALGYDDISNDGQVPTSLIDAITTLDVGGKSISNLTGIEDFTALKTLYITTNLLTSIDLSSLLNLDRLYAQENSLSSIDLSSNTLLTYITCRDNAITSLDLSNNPNVTNLYFSNNDITSLDLTNNPNLKVISIPNNDLNSLDIRNGNNSIVTTFNTTGNSNLTCISVDDATYSSTNWTNIEDNTNFSESNYCHYTAIPDVNFEAALIELGLDDVSGDGQAPTALIETATTLFINSREISDLTGIEDFTALTTLNCNTNTITNLDLTANTNLTLINCSSNDLTTLNISNCLLLEELLCTSNELTSLDITNNNLLTKINAGSNNLTSIDLSGNILLEDLSIDDNTITTLDLSKHTALNSLNIFKNNISELNLDQNTNLEYLDFSENPLTSIDLSNNLSLIELYAYHVNLTGNIDLSKHLFLTDIDFTNNNLTSLDVSNGANTNILYFTTVGNSNLNCIRVDDVDYSATNWTNIEDNTSFSDTYCNYTTIPDTNFEAALEALGYDDISGDGQVPTVLIEVVSSLNIHNKGISDLTGLENFKNLQTLLCRGNSINTIDISQNLLLETLTANNNSIGTIDLSNNTSLKSVNLGANGLATIDVSNNLLLETLGLQSNGGLTTLDISNNTLLKELRTYNTNIAALNINNNTALQTVQVYNSPITTLDVTNNPDITDLRVHDTNITAIDLSNNSSIEQLRVNGTNIESLDLSNQTALQRLYANNMSVLSSINVKNGNNTNINVFRLTDNPSLSCIRVDDADYSTANWTEIDSGVAFSDTYCRYTAIPDTNFEAALDALGYDDISNDGQVPTALIEGVTNLNVSNKNISSLSGIEGFSALLDLNIQDNSLLNVDLSNNTLLEDLNCSSNKFVFLDLSANTVLNSLYADNNWLIELDLSANTQLQYLYLVDNQLISLNLQNGNNTNSLFFDATSNANLTCILVDDADYSTTNWTAIEATTSFSNTYCEYTSIPDANFEAALEALGLDDITADGQVPTALIENEIALDVSNSSITDLTGIEDFEALVLLNCSNNQLTTLDLSSNNELKNLDVSSNTLKLLDLNTGVSIIVASSNNLKFLDLRDHTSLSQLTITNNNLIYLNLQNGTNTNLITSGLNTLNNPDLNCIIVDDVNYSTTNWNSIDDTTNFSTSYCRYTQIPDTNFEAHLESLGYDDISSDGQVPTALIIDVLFLDASFESAGAIYDFTGIQDFFLLDNIFLTDNLMTSIDVSSNSYLQQFNANNTALTSIDLSSNTALNYVTLSDSDNLSSVNLRNGSNTNFVGSSSFTALNVPNLSCVLVDDASYANATWVNHVDPQITFNEVSCNSTLILEIKAYLQGALSSANVGEENLMRDDLRVSGLVPTTSPYTDTLTCESTVLDITGENGIVDWVWVELRDATDSSVIMYETSALLQRDGDIVSIDGVSPLNFSTINDTYYIAINHRNHLRIMSNAAITFSDNTTSTLDLSTNTSIINGGNNAVVDMGNNLYAMIAGDVDDNGQVQNSDIDISNTSLGSSGYTNADTDLNAQVQNSDIQSIILTNSGKGEQITISD